MTLQVEATDSINNNYSTTSLPSDETTVAAAATAGQTLLNDQFSDFRSGKSVRLELTNECLRFFYSTLNKSSSLSSSSVPDFILHLNDVAGSSIGKGEHKGDTKSYLTIYAYIQSKKRGNEQQQHAKRKRRTFELAFAKFPSYEDNLNYINKWHSRLYKMLKFKSILRKHSSSMRLKTTTTTTMSIDGNNNNETTTDINQMTFVKPFLVFINPKSGSGKAKSIYFERVLPVWAEANFPDTTVFTS
jgi:hypothetical protein